MKLKTAFPLVLAGLALAASAASRGPAKPTDLWRGTGEKNRLNGPTLEASDLIDRVVLVAEFNTVSLKDFPFATLEEAVRYSDDKRFSEVCSLRGSKMNAAKFAERLAKLKMAVGENLPIYQDIGVTTNEPSAEAIPFYYVVDAKGAVIHSGTDASAAVGAASAAANKLPPDDPLFGISLPDKLLPAATNYFREGTLARPGMAWLKKMSADKDAEKAQEAARLLVTIPQKRDMTLKALAKESESSPGMAAWKLEAFLKMWPDQKTHPLITEMKEQQKEYPDQVKMIKIVQAVEREALKPVKKAAEAKKAAAFYKANVLKLERLQKSKDLVAADEAARYSSRVGTLADEMKEWAPPPPPAPPAEAAQ